MFMKKLGQIPHYQIVLGLLAMAALFLPNGIPYTNANCGPSSTWLKSAYNLQSTCDACLTDCQGQCAPIAQAYYCTLNGSQTKCEITLTIHLEINQDGCQVRAGKYCSSPPQPCGGDDVVATGRFSQSGISRTVSCTQGGDRMEVRFYVSDGCDLCDPPGFAVGTAYCAP